MRARFVPHIHYFKVSRYKSITISLTFDAITANDLHVFRIVGISYIISLGMKFHYTVNLEPDVKALSDQALQATNCLLSLFKLVSFDLKTKYRYLTPLSLQYYCMGLRYGECKTSIVLISSD